MIDHSGVVVSNFEKSKFFIFKRYRPLVTACLQTFQLPSLVIPTSRVLASHPSLISG